MRLCPADSTFSSSNPQGRTQGRYRFEPDGKMRMEFNGFYANFGVKVVGDALTICQENVRCELLRRES